MDGQRLMVAFPEPAAMKVQLNPAIVILCSDDVILTEIIPRLHFDEDEWSISRVLDPVPGALGDVYGLTGREQNLFIISGHNGPAFEYEPVLSPASVLLKGKSLPGLDDNPLHLVLARILKYTKMAPRPVLFLVHWLYSMGMNAACQ